MVIDKRICETRGPCVGKALRWWGSAMVGLCEGGALRGGALQGRGSARVGFCKGGGWWSSAVDNFMRGEDAGIRGGDALL